jgi:hypothetical protein
MIKPGIYEVTSPDGTRTRVHANSMTGAKRAVGGPQRTVTWLAASWNDLRKIEANSPSK